MIPSITPAELRSELDSGVELKLLDVRESDELEISKLDGITHIPLGSLPERFSELDQDANWVIICRSGGRSGQATQFLLGNGFSQVRNMVTGMNGYATTVDPSLPTY